MRKPVKPKPGGRSAKRPANLVFMTAGQFRRHYFPKWAAARPRRLYVLPRPSVLAGA